MENSNALYTKYNSFVCKTALSMHKKYNWAFDHEEITQIAWEKFLKAYKLFKGNEETEKNKFYAYTGLKIRNGIIDEIRKKYGRSKGSRTVKRAIPLDILDEEEYPKTTFAYPKDVTFKKLINSLDRKKRAILTLYYVWEKNQVDIGKVLNMTESGVSMSRKNALKRLKENKTVKDYCEVI